MCNVQHKSLLPDVVRGAPGRVPCTLFGIRGGGTRGERLIYQIFYSLLLLAGLVMVNSVQAAETLHDPTRPGGAPAPRAATEPAAQRWHLSSIVIADTRRVAIINDKVVAIGEQVDGATVMDIQAYAVTLRRDGRDFTLTLLDARVKTHAG